MNPVHLHLILNHLPVIGIPIGLALCLAGALRRERAVERAGLWVLLLFAVATPLAYLTGEPAEDALHQVPGVSGPHVEAHEESAEWALVSALLAGAAAGVALLLARRAKPIPVAARVGVWVLGALAALILARTANLGGQVHHPELRSSASARARASIHTMARGSGQTLESTAVTEIAGRVSLEKERRWRTPY